MDKPIAKQLVSNGFKLFRESLGFNMSKMTRYLEIGDQFIYSCYERGNSIPLMREFVRISNIAKSKCFDIRHVIYPQFYYKGPIVRESSEWIEVGSFLELREALGLNVKGMTKLFENYIVSKSSLRCWEVGDSGPRANSGLVIDTFARENKIRLLDTIWIKHTNKKAHNERIWGKEGDKMINRRMNIVEQSLPLVGKPGLFWDRAAAEKFEDDGESVEVGEPKSPVDCLRRKCGLTRQQFGNLIYVRGKGLAKMLSGELIPSIHLAKVIQEEARKRGVAVTLDEIYQNVVIGG